MSRGCAVIVGSAFDARPTSALELESVAFDTPYGAAILHRASRDRNSWVLFRHGFPHRLLPNQINYRANAWALREAGVGSLLITSSVGVMDPELPLFRPLPVDDVTMLENRLPDGSACTIFTDPQVGQGHLVLNDGLISSELTGRVLEIAARAGIDIGPPATFTYVQGPRTKTAAENRMLQASGAQVNSMTLAPEAVLANELEISVAAFVVGHKYSIPDRPNPDESGIGESLESSRRATVDLVEAYLEARPLVPFANHIYRFGDES